MNSAFVKPLFEFSDGWKLKLLCKCQLNVGGRIVVVALEQRREFFFETTLLGSGLNRNLVNSISCFK
jgi:hypothetical protein